jgi:hypothetical protein
MPPEVAGEDWECPQAPAMTDDGAPPVKTFPLNQLCLSHEELHERAITLPQVTPSQVVLRPSKLQGLQYLRPSTPVVKEIPGVDRNPIRSSPNRYETPRLHPYFNPFYQSLRRRAPKHAAYEVVANKRSNATTYFKLMLGKSRTEAQPFPIFAMPFSSLKRQNTT